MDITNRMVAAFSTLAMLLVLFVVPSARADEAPKLQDRLDASAIVADVTISQAQLASAARRLAPLTVTVETRTGPNTSVLTRVPVALSQR